MTKEQIKAYAVKQFPNDEFKQQIVIDAINWATKELQDKISVLCLFGIASTFGTIFMAVFFIQSLFGY